MLKKAERTPEILMWTPVHTEKETPAAKGVPVPPYPRQHLVLPFLFFFN